MNIKICELGEMNLPPIGFDNESANEEMSEQLDGLQLHVDTVIGSSFGPTKSRTVIVNCFRA